MKYQISLIFLFVFTMAYSQESSKQEDIKKLLRLTQSTESADMVMNTAIGYFKNQKPTVPDSYWQDLRASISYEKFLDKVIPVYDKYFTHQEIKDLLSFFQSPTGKKYASVLPQLNEDIYKVGKEYGKYMATYISQKLVQDGY